ncbi:MAG: VWA domain-containing protein [Leptolyngbya sp. PLA3]|nr:MAG: VWA domain-containing protein [Cyanobacteria bacterium CYA]MCE7968301.1 VWA domain-containing protein [Leptolyngbya sp. PL-A3]
MIHLGAPGWIHAMWLVPGVVLAGVHAMGARRRARRRFADDALLDAIMPPRRVWVTGVKIALTAVGMAGIVIALLQPQWNKREIPVSRRGREVVFVVDVSRSMLAADLAPNRLERAKLWIRDLTSVLEGDSVGLVAFAGASVVKCPLTRDVGFFELALEELSPETAPRGGTMIGDAIRKAVTQVFERSPRDGDETGGFRDLVLITDGEDQGSLPVAAAETAAAAGVRIIAIGLGSDTQGTPVPDPDRPGEFLTYEGKQVRSVLDSQTLADVAKSTPGGVYLKVGTGNIALDEVYRDLIRSGEQTTLETSSVTEYQQMFWIFLAIGLAGLFVEPLLEDQRRWSA